eukprot:CAMPEP_0206287050 /NCGR_PEP_ID=MMETSP0106_2-20121207/911_1 /ASSEMBLY_ACC=CAM_ASM_000206 /TAXON_ID=81532 /ORGANISM="Acanthoeca-like sp., Strain 10tr" /LENGTH=601 /DNA_ID=CAMNT_0053717581 /DNA_START=151 /DNA_END=1952 /DNA_ORIENTATION=-
MFRTSGGHSTACSGLGRVGLKIRWALRAVGLIAAIYTAIVTLLLSAGHTAITPRATTASTHVMVEDFAPRPVYRRPRGHPTAEISTDAIQRVDVHRDATMARTSPLSIQSTGFSASQLEHTPTGTSMSVHVSRRLWPREPPQDATLSVSADAAPDAPPSTSGPHDARAPQRRLPSFESINDPQPEGKTATVEGFKGHPNEPSAAIPCNSQSASAKTAADSTDAAAPPISLLDLMQRQTDWPSQPESEDPSPESKHDADATEFAKAEGAEQTSHDHVRTRLQRRLDRMRARHRMASHPKGPASPISEAPMVPVDEPTCRFMPKAAQTLAWEPPPGVQLPKVDGTVAVVGIARNIGRIKVRHAMVMLTALGELVFGGRYNVFFVENDSTDCTGTALREWEHLDPARVHMSTGRLNAAAPRVGDHMQRIRRLAGFRNRVIQSMRDHPDAPFDYVLVIDLDLKPTWDVVTLVQPFLRQQHQPGFNFNMVCASGVMSAKDNRFYDAFAFRSEDYPSGPLDVKQYFGAEGYVSQIMEGLRRAPGDPPVSVWSCFSGLAWYRGRLFSECNYTSPDGDCEHVHMHGCMRERFAGTKPPKFWMLPAMRVV